MGEKTGIQISLCHLLFNIFGILIWYPIPKMRRLPLAMARTIAGHAQKFKPFGSIYIMVAFILTPLVLFGFSFAINLGAGGVILNIILTLMTVAAAIGFVWKFDRVARKLGMKAFDAVEVEETKPKPLGEEAAADEEEVAV